jgi:hypothetical protein
MTTARNKIALENGTILDERLRPGSIFERASRLDEPHIRELEDWARALASAHSEDIPSFDPSSAGIGARALFLLQDPSRLAVDGGFISIDNNDQTAHNCSKAYAATGLDRSQTLHWNVIPWWVHHPSKNGPGRTLSSEARRAREPLVDLLNMLKNLDGVVLLGRQAQTAWDRALIDGIHVLRCPHPSQQAWNNVDQASGRLGRELTTETFGHVARDLARNRP